METTTKRQEKQQAIEELKEMIGGADTLYTILKHVSSSGMTRGIDVYVIKNGRPMWLTGLISKAGIFNQPMNYWKRSLGLKVGGCGMDMGFHVVYSVSSVVFGDGYKVRQEWL